MELYLVQHGEAKSASEDPERPLTERGREDVRRVGAFTARIGVHPAEIRHSGKRRAQETAVILADALSLREQVHAVSGLAPNDDVKPVAEALCTSARSVMLVGHLPFVSRLASLLLVGDLERPIVRFRQGGIVCLAGEQSAQPAKIAWSLAWMVTPETVPH